MTLKLWLCSTLVSWLVLGPAAAAERAREPITVMVSGSGRKPGAVFRDCPDCPEMVIIPAGIFTMGSSDAEKSWAASHGGSLESVADEAPQHIVSIRSFAFGRYDVTRAQYRAFVGETGYSPGPGCYESSMPGSPKRPMASWQNADAAHSDTDPVVCISWQDAHAYIVWLNKKVNARKSTGNDGPYRLPSEAEWEYAARAGTTTRFWWGDDETAADAHAWYNSNSDGHLHRVGMKPANAFGLYDIVGNVWQLTEDCYKESYAGAPMDGRANESPQHCMRVDRGSCWLYPAWLLRSATRENNPADYRDLVMGFRVARAISEAP